MSDVEVDDRHARITPVSSPSQNYLVSRQLAQMPAIFARGFFYVVLLLVAAGLLYAAIVEVDVSVAAEAVIVSDHYPFMQYTEGSGFIRDIYIRQWDTVEAGSSLYRLEINKENGREYLVVRSRSAGIVSVIHASSIGAWVTETTPLCVITPEPTRFSTRIFVDDSDIGSIDTGMLVVYKLKAYPHSEFGVFTGEITAISTSALTASDGTHLYQVRGTLDSRIAQTGENSFALRDGMTAMAELHIGKRTILSMIIARSST
jgi:hypothetical protein